MTTSNPGPTKPPKSKTEPYYSISPLWSDVIPIPQIDLDNPSTSIPGVPANTGPALATITYTPRYTEAMSYLRSVMAANEYSERVLALTEDVIGMNPAHYTVWLYRFRALRELWGIGGNLKEVDRARFEDEKVIRGVEAELQWLKPVSERHLKNYQIWHHRHSLVDLLPALPPTELSFLHHILSFDTKNYHVWSYRQWLCTRFPDPLLTTPVELVNTSAMLTSDVRNNSAWNHRYFVAFGHKELTAIDADPHTPGLRGPNFTIDVADLDAVDRELDYTKRCIRMSPQNGSAWNYLRGVMKHGGIPVSEMKEFAGEFVGENYDFETVQNDADGVRGVRSSYAVELLVEVFAGEGEKAKVREGLDALGRKWDPIRRKYWEYRLMRYMEMWGEEGGGGGEEADEV